MTGIQETQEGKRLAENLSKTKYWKRWGPYLSERQWGTVREDYSAGGNAWENFPHDHARSRAYRWGEDGIAGICDNHQRLCFAIALWNGEDPILKERLYGFTGNEGNHGEDVKEYYFYLDNTPTHSYMKCLYKYPQVAFPYSKLLEVNSKRNRWDPEYELLDTGVFNENRYFDVFTEYAKNSPDDILIKITVINQGPEEKTIHLLPTLWFRNTWSWGYQISSKPSLKSIKSEPSLSIVEAFNPDRDFGKRWLYCEAAEELLFTENETNTKRLFGVNNSSDYVKDGINNYIVNKQQNTVNRNLEGTKASAHYTLKIAAGETKIVRLRLSDLENLTEPFGNDFESSFQTRTLEADDFYKQVCPFDLSDEMRNLQRQAFAGMLWSKQFYHYIVQDWLNGDPAGPKPPDNRKEGRNHEWIHLFTEDILSMPDKWEYPWFAAWDLAFHTIPLAMIDPDFAKRQLYLLTREWYMHPNGQMPAYEWAFGDVNPPVHAWAALRVYKIEQKMYNNADTDFLERVFEKLLLYFTWWVNRKDAQGNNIFQGGFLGMDNISIFDRSATNLPTGGYLDQADGTSWMGMYCLNMFKIAVELAKTEPSYQDMASKFFQHFLYIAQSINSDDPVNSVGGQAENLWDEQDGFYYDILHFHNGSDRRNDKFIPLKIHSMVGLIPLFSVETIDLETLEPDNFSDFKQRFEWFVKNRKNLMGNVASLEETGLKGRRILSLVDQDKLRKIMQKMLDEAEFLSLYGIRSISKYHQNNPFTLQIDGRVILDDSGNPYEVSYQPAESRTALFGGNSNWRGPVWFPINFLIIESLQKFHYYLGDDFQVEFPSHSGNKMTLWEVSMELSQRLLKIFLKDSSGKRPVYGGTEKFQTDPNWRDLILFYEYFHGDNGAGIGASHQTGWTGVVAKLIQQWAEYPGQNNPPQPD